MAKIGNVQEVPVSRLVPYERNAKIHSTEQVKQIAESIKEFGFLNPVLVDKDYNVIAGHGRVLAVQELGMESVPCLFIEGLTEEQKRAYILADNRLSELSGWDYDLLDEELSELSGIFNMGDFGFDVDDISLEENDYEEPEEDKPVEQEYSRKAKIPQYEPTGVDVPIESLCQMDKTLYLIDEIKHASISDDIKDFLIEAAHRHTVFNYRNIAEFYANAEPTVQRLMEKSALVIIDINDAIANGYVILGKAIEEVIDEEENEDE